MRASCVTEDRDVVQRGTQILKFLPILLDPKNQLRNKRETFSVMSFWAELNEGKFKNLGVSL